MKKIISALTVSALVIGSAAAKTSVNLNYRNGAYLYNYTNNGEEDAKNEKTSTFGALNGYNGGQDTLSFKASGDILDFQLDLQPSIKNDGSKSDQLRFNVLKIGAKWGDFHVQSGWNGDGLNGGYRVTNDASNNEGIFFETFKLGSLFSKSLSKYADNQIAIANAFDDRSFYAQADYTIAADDLKVNLKGSVISDRYWKDVNKEQNTGDKGWSIFADVSLKDMFKTEAFVKGANVTAKKKDEAATDSRLALVPGLYFQWLGTENLIATVGGAATIYDGDFSDFSVDLRARYAVSGNLAITYYLKYSKLDTDKFIASNAYAANGEIDKNVGLGAKFTTDAVLWNFVNASYKMSPSVTLACSLGALTDLGDGAVADNKETKNGTTISVHPNAEFFAGKGASITVGLATTFAGLGAEKDSKFGENTDIAFAIPVLFRVKM